MTLPAGALLPLALLLTATAPATQGTVEPWQAKVDPWVIETGGSGEVEFLVFLREQADLRFVPRLAPRSEKGRHVVDRLRAAAQRSQQPLLELLADRGVDHRPLWIANMIWVRGDLDLVRALAQREDVARVNANPRVRLAEPVAREASGAGPTAIEWGVARVRAPEMWAAGFTGQGAVIGGQDTGYDWDHPALKAKYRGWNGTSANHNYNWHDAIHGGGGVCGPDSPEPCDDDSHGTHTMGTMVGDDGGSNQIGVAPGARWIGCRNMNQGVGTPATYAECFQWFIAPTDLQNQNPDPSQAPDVINNSWTCPPSEGCTDPNVLAAVVGNTRAAGIVVVASAGNAGPGCSTVSDPPAIYDASFSIGATSSAANDPIASFSSRGPVTVDGSNRLKPDVSAPGVSVRSSVPGGGYASFSGTSMAGPHVAGVTALLLSALPQLSGQVDALEALMIAGAVPRTSTQTCGGVPGDNVPNNTYGHGRVDAFASLQSQLADLALDKTGPARVLVGDTIQYAIDVTNLGPATAVDVVVSDVLPEGVAFVSATPSQGSCGQGGDAVNCALGGLAVGASAQVAIAVVANQVGSLVNSASVSAQTADATPANNTDEVTTVAELCPPATPVITAPWSVAPETTGLQASVPPTAGHDYAWTLGGGQITAGQGSPSIEFTSGAPGTTMELAVVDSVLGCASAAGTKRIQADFLDVPPAHPFHDWVAAVARGGVTAGCGGGNFCPAALISRAQMAVFLLRARHGSGYVPPPATGTLFADVAASDFAAAWIEQLFVEGISGGCGVAPLRYCPNASVTRATMAALLLKAREGSAYLPPPATGTLFADVPQDHPFARWIEELFRRGVTAGCGGGNYCPDTAISRGQMSVFVSKTFDWLAPGAPQGALAAWSRLRED